MNKSTRNTDSAPNVAWNGVTIEELRFMRASALIKLEMQKSYLKRKAAETLPVGTIGKGANIAAFSAKMSLIQKVILVAKGMRLASNIVSFFRKNKR